ncbi:MAG TPA: multiheme c-type cytochrome [Gemmataceae bacterium]|nr:multiheme c-type cytochrome [Gemmataceae bacterium]
MLRKVIKRLAGSLVLLAVLAAALVAWQAPAQAPDEALPVTDSRPHVPLKCQGVSSCTAAACHNAGGPDGSKRSEYTTWFRHDRHAHAFAVLGGKQSEIIARNLAAGGKIVPAKENTLCLKCHALAPELAGKKHAYVNDDGVSCESCHGRAEKWLSIHYLPEWQKKSDEDKLHYGMTPTKNLVYRAKQCAACHVGSPENDLNHDLYAAGHPPLYYEFSAFLGSMPKHWSEQEEKARYPDLELRAWAVGQLTSAQAALELLAARAEHKQKPWPEFAEYNCYACHHSLRVGSPSTPIAGPGRRTPGALPWNSWFTALLPDAVSAFSNDRESKLLGQQVTTLGQQMEQPLPNREQVAGEASSLAHQLGRLLSSSERLRYDEATLRALIGKLPDQAGYVAPADWEQAAQAYLAGAAVYRTRRDLHPGYANALLKRTLDDLRRRLEVPDRYENRAGFDK